MLNLDNLRKQAKQILRWHRDRHYTVAAEIRATLPRFEKLSDLQVLDAPFKLADAQELVARRQGFENWQALKAGALTMSIIKQPTTTTKPVISATEAVVYVTDSTEPWTTTPRSSGLPSSSPMAIRRSTDWSRVIRHAFACGSCVSPSSSAMFVSASSCSLPP